MKKFRCPHCGDECLTIIDKTCFYESHKTRLHCKVCKNPVYLQHKYDNSWYPVLAICLGLVLITLYILLYIFRIPLLIAGALLAIFIIHIGCPFVSYLSCSFTKYEYSNYSAGEANAVVELDNTRKVDNLDIFAIKFNESTNDVRFHEAFIKDLVPIVFYKSTKKQNNPIIVKIMKSQFIPKDLLKVGAEFSVIDNGKNITSGKITKIYD